MVRPRFNAAIAGQSAPSPSCESAIDHKQSLGTTVYVQVEVSPVGAIERSFGPGADIDVTEATLSMSIAELRGNCWASGARIDDAAGVSGRINASIAKRTVATRRAATG
jgi:hypothetical protein